MFSMDALCYHQKRVYKFSELKGPLSFERSCSRHNGLDSAQRDLSDK